MQLRGAGVGRRQGRARRVDQQPLEQGVDRLGRQRARQEEALTGLAAGLLQARQLAGAFDAFGHHGLAERLAHHDDRAHHRFFFDATLQIGDEAAVELEAVDRQAGLGAAAQWGQIGAGVAFALAASFTFGLALVLTQHEAGDLDGRLRTATTMAMVGLLAGLAATAQGGFHWPQATPGWWGLALLTGLYGTGITILFTVLPRLGVVGNSAIMNVEPVFALGLAWVFLNQSIAPVQLLGAALVVCTVIWLGLRR